MDLQTPVFLLFVFFTAGHTLSCYECMDYQGSCANQIPKTCPSGADQCIALTTKTQVATSSATMSFKDCTTDCANGSMNFGIIKLSAACCNTDQCNTKNAPDPPISVPNGKSCYFCDGNSCSNIVNCLGSEDQCIKATGTFGGESLVVKGCATKSVCVATTISSVQSFTCCSGNLCNGAQAITHSFLFLCVTFISFLTLL